MSAKPKKLLNNNKLREIKVSDSLTNLEEFTRIMSDDIDFNSFDVLSITRVDTDQPYTRNFAQSHIETRTHQRSDDDSQVIPLGDAKHKLN